MDYVDPNDPSKGGTASTVAQFNLPQGNAINYYIQVRIGGNYQRSDVTLSPTDATLMVIRPTPGGTIYGGTMLCNDNSAGFVKGLVSDKADLNFNVFYNKKLTNLSGYVELDVISGHRWDNPTAPPVDGVKYKYRIKSTAYVGMNITASKAQVTSKANIVRIHDNGFIESIEGNCKLVLELEDGNIANPPSPDKVGVTLFRNKGGVWYSNNWDPARSATVPASINGCNLPQSMADVNVTGSVAVGATGITSASNSGAAIQEPSQEFDVKVWGNPTVNHFILAIRGSSEKVNVKVVDVAGRVVETRAVSGNSNVKIGSDYMSGTYFAELTQGSKRKTVVMIKNQK